MRIWWDSKNKTSRRDTEAQKIFNKILSVFKIIITTAFACLLVISILEILSPTMQETATVTIPSSASRTSLEQITSPDLTPGSVHSSAISKEEEQSSHEDERELPLPEPMTFEKG